MLIAIITTTDSKKNAKKIADTLLKERLAACIQIDKIISYYTWQGKIERQKEYRLTIKTQNGHYKKLVKAIKKIHSYDIPEIIKINIDKADKSYAKWVKEVT